MTPIPVTAQVTTGQPQVNVTYGWQKIQAWAQATDPGKVSAAGAAFRRVAQCFNDSLEVLHKTAQDMSQAWNGSPSAQAAQTQLQQLYVAAQQIAVASDTSGGALQAHGENDLAPFKEYFSSPAWTPVLKAYSTVVPKTRVNTSTLTSLNTKLNNLANAKLQSHNETVTSTWTSIPKWYSVTLPGGTIVGGHRLAPPDSNGPSPHGPGSNAPTTPPQPGQRNPFPGSPPRHAGHTPPPVQNLPNPDKPGTHLANLPPGAHTAPRDPGNLPLAPGRPGPGNMLPNPRNFPGPGDPGPIPVLPGDRLPPPGETVPGDRAPGLPDEPRLVPPGAVNPREPGLTRPGSDEPGVGPGDIGGEAAVGAPEAFAGAPYAAANEPGAALASEMAPSGGMMAPTLGGGAGDQGKERGRSAWLAEESDTWTGDFNSVAPPVLGVEPPRAAHSGDRETVVNRSDLSVVEQAAFDDIRSVMDAAIAELSVD